MTVKDLIILFQEWQLETKPPNYNFTHNGVANNFIEQNDEVNHLNTLSDNWSKLITDIEKQEEDIKYWKQRAEHAEHKVTLLMLETGRTK